MTFAADFDTHAATTLAEYVAGGYEPDGIGMALGAPPSDDADALGYGSDLAYDATTRDVFADMRELDGASTDSVLQMIDRIIDTERGKIIADSELLQAVDEDPNFGYRLTNLLSVGASDLQIRAHMDLAAATILANDDRVSACAVDLVPRDASGDVFALTISGTLKTGGSFARTRVLTRATLPELVKP